MENEIIVLSDEEIVEEDIQDTSENPLIRNIDANNYFDNIDSNIQADDEEQEDQGPTLHYLNQRLIQLNVINNRNNNEDNNNNINSK